MAPRPTDWNAIGLSGDPTPGDPDRIDEVARSMSDLGRVAREIDDALNAVLNKTGDGAFVGQTADALRDKISGPLRGFVQSVAEAFESSSRALTTYVAVMRDQQWRADNALDQGRGLAEDDPRRAELAATARQAGSAQAEAGNAAGGTLSSAARGIKQPVSDCDLFWEIFNWLAIILIIPALIFGGPIALLAIGVNLTLFIKTAVDFAHGKASGLDLFLSGLGMIAPTTKGIPLLKLISTGAKLTWQGIRNAGRSIFNFFRDVFTGGGLRSFSFLPELRGFASLTGTWFKSGLLWTKVTLTRLPGWTATAFQSGGFFVVQGIKTLNAIRNVPPMLLKGGTVTWNFTKTQLGGTKWLRLVLPVDAAEIGKYGLGGALRIGFVERGLLGNFRYGAPLLSTAGRTAAAIPIPPPLHQVDALVDLSRTELARVRLGDWSGPPNLDIPPFRGASGVGFSRPPTFTTPGGLGEHLSFAPEAVRRLDALLDIPVRELNAVRMGEWSNLTFTPTGVRMDVGLGISAHNPAAVLDLNAGTFPGMANIGAPVLQTPPLPTVGAIGTVQPPGLVGSAPATHLPSFQAQSFAPPTSGAQLASPHVWVPETPSAQVTAQISVPRLTGNPATALPTGTPAVTPVVAPTALPTALPGVSSPVGQVHNALDLLSTSSPMNRADAPVFNTGGHLGEGTPHALTAHQINLHLNEFSPRTVTPPASSAVPGTVLPPVAQHGQSFSPPLNTPAALNAPLVTPQALTNPPALGGTVAPQGIGAHSAVSPPAGVGHDPLESALGLLDDGAPRGTGAPPATGTNGAPAPLPVPVPSQLPGQTHLAGQAPPSTPPAPRGGSERLTGAQIDRLWNEHSERVANLFGTADDPARVARIEAWADLVRARNEFASADRLRYDLTSRPGSASTGPSAFEIQAQRAVDVAKQRVADNLDRLADLGVEPAKIERGLAELTAQSLRERPRLLGGSSGGSLPEGALGGAGLPENALTGTVQQPVRLTLNDPTTGPNGWTVETTFGPDGTANHRLLNAGGTEDPLLRPAARPDGGFDIHSLDGGHRGFDGDGRLVEEGRPLLGADNTPLGPILLLRHENGTITHSLTRPGQETLHILDGGAGLRLTHPTTGHSIRFDPHGRYVEQGLSLANPNGIRGTHFTIPDGTGGHILTDATGTHLPDQILNHPGGGLRIEQPPTTPGAGIRYERYDTNGIPTHNGQQLLDANSNVTGYLDRPIHHPAPPQWLNNDFHPDAGRPITTEPNGNIRVGDPDGGHRGFDGDGRLVEEGRPLLGADNTPLGPILLLRHENGTITHSLTRPGQETLHILDGGAGLRLTHPTTGHSIRFDPHGRYVEQGLSLANPNGIRGTHFTIPDGTGGHILTDATGTHLPDQILNHPGGGLRIEQPPTTPGAGIRYERYDTNGIPTHNGQQLLDANSNVTGYLDRPIHHPAPPQWLNNDFHPDAGRPITTEPNGNIRVGDPDGGYRVFDDTTGHLVDDATRLRDPGGPLDRWVRVHHPQDGGPRILEVVDNTGTVQPHLTVTERPGGIHQVTDNNAGNSFVRYGADGSRLETGSPLRGLNGNPDNTFAVVPEPDATGVRAPGRLENAAGDALPHRTVTMRANGDLEVSFRGTGGPRDGEYRVHSPGGAVTEEGFNVLKDGRRTDFQYVVDHTVMGGATWQRRPHPDAPQQAGDTTGIFHHGAVKISGDGSRVRLFSAMGAKVEVFERRAVPSGGVLDAFRRTDTLRFGYFTRRTTWVHWDDSGTMLDRGTRHYDTSGFGWKDENNRFRTVHEYREGLHKSGGQPGHTFAVKGADGRWTWHRFDGTGRELAHGPRTVHGYGWGDGWSDHLGNGTLVQKQWGGKTHLPENAGHYQEYGLGANGNRQDTWKRQSPQGKESGARENLGDGVLTTVRWSEQRPPLLVRRALIHITPPETPFRHLRTDNRFQIFSWTKEGGQNPGSGFRYVGMDGGMVDLAADGRFVRSTTKLHAGGTLKVGDHAARPGYNPPAGGGNLPWEEPGRSGYRVSMTPDGTGQGPGVPLWQDRFQDAGTGRWMVAREGFADGSVREYRTPHAAPAPAPGQVPAPAPAPEQAIGAWVQRDAHGTLVGEHQTWRGAGDPPAAPATPGAPQPTAIRPDITVTGTGRPDSAEWRWTATDHQGNEAGSGRRLAYRGSSDPSLPWDDSFRDFAGDVLVRGRDMLDGGRYVDSWRVTDQIIDPATGQIATREHWLVQKYDASGNPVSYGNGDQVRRWWNPETRAWGDEWFDGAVHFRDEFRPAGGGPTVTVREVPPHLSGGDGPLRVREYQPGGGGNAPTPGTWKEFDHGTVVRERTALGDGTFLEKDAWRSQWRHYDAAGQTLAQRTSSGLVFEGGPGGLRPTGNEYDFRGQLTEVRGFGRRVREAQRLPWDGSASVRVPHLQNALDGVPGLPAPVGGRVTLGEALYEPYWSVLAKKVALEFAQEFVLEFGANLAVNGIVASINNRPFTGQDALKALANAAVTGGIKGTFSTATHEIRGAGIGKLKSADANVDGGKLENRHPNNHDKHWANEWAGNESPTRWRGGIYDFGFNSALGAVSGFVNGSMNAAVWGITGADGQTRVLSGTDALGDGGIMALAGLTTAGGTSLARNLVMMGAGGRLFHRQGFGEFWLQIPFKIFEKTVNTVWLAPAMRAGFNPSWYQAPPPPSPPPGQGPQQQGQP